jgi:hypothetical protein
MGYANLLVESSQGGSVFELLEILLGSSAAALALGDNLNSTLVDSGGQVHLQNLGADRTRKLQERERCTRLDDNGLKTIVKHVRSNKLKLLRDSQLDRLAKTTILGQRLRVVSQNCCSNMFGLPYLAMDSVILEGNVNRGSTTESSGQLVELLGRSTLSRSLLGFGGGSRRNLIAGISLGSGRSHGSLLL